MNVKEYKHYLTNNSLVVSLHLLLSCFVSQLLMCGSAIIFFLLSQLLGLNLLLIGCVHLAHAAIFSLFINLLHVVAGSQHLVLDHTTALSISLLSLSFRSLLTTTSLVEGRVELLQIN